MIQKKITKDIIIIGSGISGLVAAHTASELGFNTLIIEKSKRVGGVNISHTTKKGKIFDYGYHALDFNRSKTTTKFFKEMLDSKFYKLKLKRGIVLKNELIMYNSSLKKWPKNLRKLFGAEPNIDNIIPPITKKKIEKSYGVQFAEFIFSEILFSYPTIKWAIANKAKYQDIIDIAYPWFFPRVLKSEKRKTESEKFHDQMRETENHYILYPKNKGFGEFINKIQTRINKKCKIIKNAKNTKFIFDSKGNLRKIIIKDKEFVAKKYFWCTSPIVLLNLMKKNNVKIKKKINQKMIIGNFTFKNPISIDYHEILVGSVEHKINRISFPGKIQQKKNLQVQIEFLITDNYPKMTKNEWKKSWRDSLKNIKIVNSENKIVEFNIIEEPKGYTTIEKYEEIKSRYEKKIEKVLKDSNIVFPYLNLGPENLNRVIPETKKNVINSLRT